MSARPFVVTKAIGINLDTCFCRVTDYDRSLGGNTGLDTTTASGVSAGLSDQTPPLFIVHKLFHFSASLSLHHTLAHQSDTYLAYAYAAVWQEPVPVQQWARDLWPLAHNSHFLGRSCRAIVFHRGTHISSICHHP